MRCRTPGSVLPARRRKRMASAVERRIFWGAALLIVTLDALTKLIAEATLLLTPGVPVIGDWFRQLALGLVAGGAAGNLVDRVRSSRGVVDFLDLGVGALRWPTFNVADIDVSCGG